jgi:hypothetical protein
MRKSTLLVACGMLWLACSDGEGERGFWNADSVRIDFSLQTPVSGPACEFSATRAELTQAQLEGLSALKLHEGIGGAGCDIYQYSIMVHAQGGSATFYRATENSHCANSPFLLFGDFDAWANSTPCSMQAVVP